MPRKGLLHRLVIAAVLACVVGAFPRSAEAGGEAQKPRVVFINPGITGEVFWTLVCRTMQAAADQLDISLTIDTAERNRVRMKQLALATIRGSNKPDAIILVNEEQASVDLMEEADARGIKVLMLLNDIVGKDREETGEPGERFRNWLGAIVPDNRSAGRRMALKLAEFAERRYGKRAGVRPIIAFYGDTITPASIDRNGGLTDVLETGETGLTLDHALVADWNAKKARELMDRVLKHYGRVGSRKPVGVWAANDPIALGAIQALRDNGLTPGKDVGVVGLNWSPEALAAVEDGSLLMTDGGHFFGGAWAMVVLRDYFDGLDLARSGPTIHFEMSPVDVGNIGAFQNSVGQIITRDAFEEIDFSRFLVGGDGDASSYDFSLEALIAATRQQL